MKRKLIALILIVTLSLASSACGEDTAKRIERLRIYTDAALQLVTDFERDKVLTAEQSQTVRARLLVVRSSLDVFIERALDLGKVDSKSKPELARLFAAVAGGVREVMNVAKPLIESAIRALGLPDSSRLLARINTLLVGIETAARLVESQLK